MNIQEKINQLRDEYQELSRIISELHEQRRKTKKKLEKYQRDLKFVLSENEFDRSHKPLQYLYIGHDVKVLQERT